MNLKQLEAFVSVADTGSFSKTAKELYLTQPTISAHISALEKELNARLLVRNTKEVHLSSKGQELYVMAKKMLAIQDEILKQFGVHGSVQEDRIILAASVVPTQYVLPSVLSEFVRENPDVRFKILEGDNDKIIEMVTSGQAEIGFIGSRDESSRCKQIPFYEDELIVMTPNNEKYRALREKSEIFDRELFKTVPFVIREEGSGTRKETERALGEIGMSVDDLNIVANMSFQEAIKKTVSQGMGITMISKLAAADYEDLGKVICFRFPEGRAFRSFNMIYAKEFKLSGKAQQLVKFIKESTKAE